MYHPAKAAETHDSAGERAGCTLGVTWDQGPAGKDMEEAPGETWPGYTDTGGVPGRPERYERRGYFRSDEGRKL